MGKESVPVGDFVVKAPMVLGHEAAGIVDQLGPGVKHLQARDHSPPYTVYNILYIIYCI